MSGLRFLAVILRMEDSLCLCLMRAQPALSESSLRTSRQSAVSTRWLWGCVCVGGGVCVGGLYTQECYYQMKAECKFNTGNVTL